MRVNTRKLNSTKVSCLVETFVFICELSQTCTAERGRGGYNRQTKRERDDGRMREREAKRQAEKETEQGRMRKQGDRKTGRKRSKERGQERERGQDRERSRK